MRLFFLLVFLIYQINANNYVSRWNNSSVCRPPSISQSQQLIRRTVTTISRPRCETRNIPSYQPMPCMPCPVIPICPQPCIPAIPILPPCPRPYPPPRPRPCPPPRPRPCPPPRPIPCVPPFDPAWRWFSLRRHRGLAMLRRRWRRRGSCGFRPRSFGRYLVALSPKYMDRITGPFGRPALCGQEFCVRVRHGNRWVVGKIADTACHGNNIEVSRAMYHRLADPGNGTIRVKWRLVSCCRHPPGESSGWRFHGCRDSSSSSCSSSSSSSCSHNHRRFDRNGGGRIDWNGSSSGSDSSSSND